VRIPYCPECLKRFSLRLPHRQGSIDCPTKQTHDKSASGKGGGCSLCRILLRGSFPHAHGSPRCPLRLMPLADKFWFRGRGLTSWQSRKAAQICRQFTKAILDVVERGSFCGFFWVGRSKLPHTRVRFGRIYDLSKKMATSNAVKIERTVIEVLRLWLPGIFLKQAAIGSGSGAPKGQSVYLAGIAL